MAKSVPEGLHTTIGRGFICRTTQSTVGTVGASADRSSSQAMTRSISCTRSGVLLSCSRKCGVASNAWRRSEARSPMRWTMLWTAMGSASASRQCLFWVTRERDGPETAWRQSH